MSVPATAPPRDWRYPYGSSARFHLQHTHLFASDIEATIAFYRDWFDADVVWDGIYAEARNVFLKIGIGAIHLYDQAPRGRGRNAVHHLGMQVVGLDELHQRMRTAGLSVRDVKRSDGSGYFMLEAPDGVLIEVFEPGPQREDAVRTYYGLGESPA